MPSLMFLLIQSHSICWLYCWIQEFPKFFKPITMGFSCLDISMIMSSSEDILVLILDIVVDMLLVVLLHINWSGVSLIFAALLLVTQTPRSDSTRSVQLLWRSMRFILICDFFTIREEEKKNTFQTYQEISRIYFVSLTCINIRSRVRL
eukprot:122930_1